MIAESTKVVVRAKFSDGNVRKDIYSGLHMKRMARDIWRGDAMTDNEVDCAFLHGFATALDVLSSGLLSSEYPLGCAIRALADVKDPELLPGEITDIAQWATPGEKYR